MTMVRQGKPVYIRLRKDLARSIKRGHAWLYSDAVQTQPAPSGSVAVLLDRVGENRIASGIYDPDHPIPLRICRTHPPLQLDDSWLEQQLTRAQTLRTELFSPDTTGYRLIAGEGDGLPGLIVDIYSDTAVLKLDGGAPSGFYQPEGIANWLCRSLAIKNVIQRLRTRESEPKILAGAAPKANIEFLENGLKFGADVLLGQKTGFFLDQRDNRAQIRNLSANKSVLNLFSFNGGFSVAAGVGGATQVTSVDIARPAIESANENWQANELPAASHQGIAIDCFQFLEDAINEKQRWDIVICDPPSFAPNEKSKARALQAYTKLAHMSAKVTQKNGLLALASCSSHVNRQAFSESCQEGLGRARRKARLLADNGLPADHPTPFAMPELRYLKFLLLNLD